MRKFPIAPFHRLPLWQIHRDWLYAMWISKNTELLPKP